MVRDISKAGIFQSLKYKTFILQIVCDKSDVYASGCAVARAFPLYSRKTSSSFSDNVKVTVEFIIISSSE